MIKSHKLKKRKTYLEKLIGFQDTETRKSDYRYPSLRKIQSFKIDGHTFERNRYLLRPDHRNEF